MVKLAQLQRPMRPGVLPADARRPVPHPHLYYAFLSYSHVDAGWAEWLHDCIEKFRVPSSIVGRLTPNGTVPRHLTPVFRDRKELAASRDLGTEIREALGASRYLIVLCSPAAAKSAWTNAEIDSFKRTRPDASVLAAIVGGEPFASEIPGLESEECLPPALRVHYDRRGRPTGKRAEPLCADLRDDRDGKRIGFLKLAAGMLGVGLDDLVQRETVRRQRRLAIAAAASLAGMAVTSGLAITAIHARDEARDERREAEGLVGFMLGDLKEKLAPIGRLDALDGVGARVLAYYHKQDTSDLPDSALLQRSRALTLMADVANSRGDLDGALRLFHEAMQGTAEAIRRKPDDPQRLFDHAQNVFWTADIAVRRGDSKSAEAAFREYKRLASRMVALEPDNMKWRMEAQYADANLGIMLYDQRRFEEASAAFGQALRTIEAISTADPGNSDYQKSLAESLAWLADSNAAAGRLDEATAERERHIALLEKLLNQSGGDVDYAEKLIPSHRALARLYAARGRLGDAIAQAREAIAHSQKLLSVENDNSKWLDFSARARLNLGDYLLASGKLAEAKQETGLACALSHSLIARDRNVAQWRALLRDCLMAEVNVALASGSKEQALSLADRAFQAARSVKTTDTIEDAYGISKAYRLIGDARRFNGNSEGARAAWTQALAGFPRAAGERPTEISERQLVLQRLGRTGEARQLAIRLARMGYRETEFRSA